MKIFKTRNVHTPSRGTRKSAGYDFYIPNDFLPTIIEPGGSINIPSGIHVKFETPNVVGIFFNKSGLASKQKLQVGACVIDEDYQGEVYLNVHNLGEREVTLKPGMKLVQMVILPVIYEDIVVGEDLWDLYPAKSERGAGGFGSTGK